MKLNTTLNMNDLIPHNMLTFEDDTNKTFQDCIISRYRLNANVDEINCNAFKFFIDQTGPFNIINLYNTNKSSKIHLKEVWIKQTSDTYKRAWVRD